MTLVAARKAAVTKTLVEPHGGTLVDRVVRGDEAVALKAHAESLQKITLTDAQVSDLEMIAVGAMSPLEGFLTKADYDSVVEDCRLADGTVWSLPITLRLDAAPAGDELALADETGRLLAVLEVAEVFEGDKQREAELVYRTTDEAHPGVAMMLAQGDVIVGGPVKVFDFTTNVHGRFLMSPAETRAAFKANGWTNVVGFQTP